MIANYDMNTFKFLLASTLREKTDSYVVRTLFNRFPSLQELLEVTEEELMTIKGVGKVKATQIVSALKIARMTPQPPQNPYTIHSPEDVFYYLKDMQYLTQEHFVVLGLNTKNHVLFRETVFIGSLNASIVHPRETFNRLIRRSCASAIVCHNHPSGDPTPSREDIAITQRLDEAGKILGVELLEHLIIGSERFISLKEKGYL